MVTDVERDYLWSTYATDPRARINLGIRRRLAPLMDNDRRKIELMNSLLMSFPGTPIIYYGDEIGMGDNIYLGDRNGVRTPMQWTPDRNGGFSRCDPARLYVPTIMDPVYGYESVNVEAQSRSLSSLLSWTKRLIAVRKSTTAFGRGSHDVHPAGQPRRAGPMSASTRTRSCCASPTCRAPRRRPRSTCRPGAGACRCEMLGRTQFPPIGELPYMVTLAPYGFFWFQLQRARQVGRDVEPTDRAGVRDAGGAAGATWMSLARTRGVSRTRGAAGLSGRAGAGSRSAARPIRRQRDVSGAVLRHRRSTGRGWRSSSAPSRGAESRYVLPLHDRVGRASIASTAIPRRSPRCGAGRARERCCDVATDPAFIALCCDNLRERPTIDEADERAPRVQADRQTARTAEAAESTTSARWRPNSPTPPCWSDRRLRRQAVPPARTRHQSRDRGRPLPHRGRGLRQHAAAARHGRTGREATRRARSPSSMRFVENQGDAWTVTSGLSRPLRRRAAPADSPSVAGESDEQRRLSAAHAQVGTARRRNAARAGEPRRHCRISRPSRSRPSDVRLWIRRDCCSAPTRSSTSLQPTPADLPEADRALVDSLLAQRASAARPHPRAAAA